MKTLLILLAIVGLIVAGDTLAKHSESAAVDRWSAEWEKCMTNPNIKIDIVKKVFNFNCPSPTPTPSPSPAPAPTSWPQGSLSPNVAQDSRKWECHVVVDCQSVDWRYFDPRDVCTYQKIVYSLPDNPETDPQTRGTVDVAYGGWCKEIR